MSFLCSLFGHKYETALLSGGEVRCVRCQAEALSVTGEMRKIAKAEVEYAERVTEGVSEEEFTKARRSSFEQTAKECDPIGTSVEAAMQGAVDRAAQERGYYLSELLAQAGGTQPNFEVPDYTPPYFETYIDARLTKAHADYQTKLRAFAAAFNHRISLLRSKNERLGRRCQRLHAKLKFQEELLAKLPVHEVAQVLEADIMAETSGITEAQLGTAREYGAAVGAAAIAIDLGLRLPGVEYPAPLRKDVTDAAE